MTSIRYLVAGQGWALVLRDLVQAAVPFTTRRDKDVVSQHTELVREGSTARARLQELRKRE